MIGCDWLGWQGAGNKDWDEYPNGRWGDGRSPAFGELSDSHFFRPTEGSQEDRLAMWGDAPIVPEDRPRGE